MKIACILISLISLFFNSCQHANNDHLLENAYGINLKTLLTDYDCVSKDGLVIVKDVEKNAPFLVGLFEKNKKSSKATFYHKKNRVTEPSWGLAIYSSWEERGGVTQYAVYYPNMKILLLGYFSGMDEY